MQALLGIIFHSLGGMASGSWYMPYNWVNKWRWEIYWIVGGIFSWLIMPYLAVVLTIPDWQGILQSAQGPVIRNTFIMGLLWGVGGLTYGLAIRYLGMSLGNSVLLGITSVVGSLGLPILRNIPGMAELLPDGLSFSDLFSTTGGRIVLLGIVILVVGIILSGRAGIIKDKDLAGNKEGVNKEFKLAKGLIIAVVSGVLSAFFSFGIDTGKEMAEVARSMAVEQNYSFVSESVGGFKYLFENNIIFFVILWGGLTTNLIWSVALIFKNKTGGDFIDRKTPLLRNYLFCALAGTTWFLQFFFYGMGETKIGNGASSWTLHMATIILTANLWGFYRKEWRSVSRRAFNMILFGIGTILLSVIVIGAAKWLYPELNALG
ncbi:L-rhamnose/proton symporter RhaT [Draconibacterium halophilum]|uniref:L-rhamnose/proton symporter RhaT n=1 Tax=Draconibacterium halophilum TaxID=2706887 RepID=A0A6C0RB30_9BACT|nr:L-rhamnose/proton symporter RhaT [Draconibacterium halophilum]QIA07634.1 L-rhamnose/proton symporter RhaT [Draconibacterium halophilum]